MKASRMRDTQKHPGIESYMVHVAICGTYLGLKHPKHFNESHAHEPSTQVSTTGVKTEEKELRHEMQGLGRLSPERCLWVLQK